MTHGLLGFLRGMGLFIVLGAAVITVVAQVGSWTDQWRIVPILSGSMAPDMPAGSAAIVLPVDPDSVTGGDVLVFTPPVEGHAVVAHRVIDATPDPEGRILTTKGDANNSADPWQFRIVGERAWKVHTVLPAMGFAAVAMGQPMVRFGLFAAVVLTLSSWLIWRLWRKPDGQTNGSADLPLPSSEPSEELEPDPQTEGSEQTREPQETEPTIPLREQKVFEPALTSVGSWPIGEL